MGVGIALLLVMRTLPLVLAAVSLLALGMAFVSPNLTALIANRGGEHTGAILGMQNAATSVGQVGGPLLGSLLFGWQVDAPYLITGVFLAGLGLAIGFRFTSFSIVR
jgi:DHA1 family multidrug resistance protein-like MFS transporter